MLAWGTYISFPVPGVFYLSLGILTVLTIHPTVHQAIAAEHEFLESLIVSPSLPPSSSTSDPSFSPQFYSTKPEIGRRPTVTGRMVGSVRTFGGEGKDARRREEEEWIRELMDGAVGRVCVPLRVGDPLFFFSVVPPIFFSFVAGVRADADIVYRPVYCKL